MLNRRTPTRRHAQTRTALETFEPRRLLAGGATELPALHVNAGGGAYTDSVARPFVSAAGSFLGGHDVAFDPATPIANTFDDTLFQSARVGANFQFSSAIPNGRYAMWLAFAEPDASTVVGQRRFDVIAEGQTIADGLDILARAAAPNTATALSVDVTISDGKLDLAFSAEQGEALVNAITLVPLDASAEAAPFAPANTHPSSNIVVAASLLRTIGQGITLFADYHRGNYPADLATLVSDNRIEFDRLANPRSATGVPRGVLSALEQVAWAQRTADYVYLASGKRYRDIEADDVIAYEAPDSVAGVINVLFGDGHVGSLPRIEAAALLGFDAEAPPTHAGTYPALPRDPLIVQAQTNARILAIAINDYSRANRGLVPPSLGAIVSRVGDLASFLSPRTGHTVPVESSGWTLEQKIAWVNAHADYVLLNPGKRSDQSATLHVLLYEKPIAQAPVVTALTNGEIRVLEQRWANELIAASEPLVVRSAVFDASGSKQELCVQFSRDVFASLKADSLVIIDAAGAVVSSDSFALVYDRATQWATFTFPGLPNGALPDGRYTAKLGGSITDVVGYPLTQMNPIELSVLAGDIDGDGTVDFDDLLTLARNYGKSGRTFAAGNVDYDVSGTVGFDDLLIVARQYGKQLSPVPLPATAAATRPVRTRAVSGILT